MAETFQHRYNSQTQEGLPQRTDAPDITEQTEQVTSESDLLKADDAATDVDPPTSLPTVPAGNIQLTSLSDNITIEQNVTTELKPHPELSPAQLYDEQTNATNASGEIEQTLTVTSTTLPKVILATPVRQDVSSDGSAENSFSNESTLTPTERSAYTSSETTTVGYDNSTSNSVTNSYAAETETEAQSTNQSFPAFDILNGTTTEAYTSPINTTLPHTTILSDIFNPSSSDFPQSTGSEKNVTVENNKPAPPDFLETSTLEPITTANGTEIATEGMFVTLTTSNDVTDTDLNVTYSDTVKSLTSEMATEVTNFNSSTLPHSNESWTTDSMTSDSTLGKVDTINTTQFATEDAFVTQPTVGSDAINSTTQPLTTSTSTENRISSENATMLTGISSDGGMSDATTISPLTTRAFNATAVLDERTESAAAAIHSSTISVPLTEAHSTSSMVSTPDEVTTSLVNGATTTPATLSTAKLTTENLTNSQSEHSTTVSTDSATGSLSTIEFTAYTEQSSTVPVANSSAGTYEPTATVKPSMLVSPGMSEIMTTQLYEGTAKSPTSGSVDASPAETHTLTTLLVSPVPTATSIPEDVTTKMEESTIQSFFTNSTTASDLDILSTDQRSSTADPSATSVSITNASPTAADTLGTTVEPSELTSSGMLASSSGDQYTLQTSIGSGFTTDNLETMGTSQGIPDSEPSSTTNVADAITNHVGLDKSTATIKPSDAVAVEASTHVMTEVPQSTLQTPVSMGTSGDTSGTDKTPISGITTEKVTEFPMQTTTDLELTTVIKTTETALPSTAVEFSESSGTTMSIHTSSPKLSTIFQTTDSSPEAATNVAAEFSSTPLDSFVENGSSKPTTSFDASVTIATSDSISTESENSVTSVPASCTTSETLSASALLSTEVNNSTTTIMYTTSTRRDDDDDDDDDRSDDDKKKKEKENKKKDDTDDETDDEDNDKESKPKSKSDEESEEDDKLKSDQHDGGDDKDAEKKKKRRRCQKQNTRGKRTCDREEKEDKKPKDDDDTDDEQNESERREHGKCSNKSDTDSDD
ncbi:hypothetical protein T265_04238 [Opisthorchis viverrini]|uniref:Uncharacterized protein n=1 Tax=Opisthorchis viverrini TaxID=6198 RepID=A0A074ZT92_OPIVI|nr:hypothetical protein T265_04238 [Opisthorchis viverrini]KER29052.1 hypothetical protein T265_04238 [Opisthorchis viverrini]